MYCCNINTTLNKSGETLQQEQEPRFCPVYDFQVENNIFIKLSAVNKRVLLSGWSWRQWNKMALRFGTI